MSYKEYFLYHEQISCSSFQPFTMLKISAGSEQHICQAYLRHEQEFSSSFRVFTILKTFLKFNQHVTHSLSSSCILPWSTTRFQWTLHMDQQTIVKMSPVKGEYQRGSFDKSFRNDTIHCIFFFFVVSILIRPQSSVRGTLWENLRLEPGPRAYESARISRRCPIFLRLFCPRFHRNLRNRMAVVRINDTAEAVFLLLLVRLLLQLVEHRELLTVVHHDDNTILNNWRLGKRRLNLRRIRCTTRSTMGLEDFDRHCPLKQKEIRLWKKERMG